MSDARCPIGADAALDALLREMLAQSHEPAPFRIDVENAVMARIAEVGAVPASGVGARELALWAAAAAAVGAVIASGVATHAPTIRQLASGLGRTTSQSAGHAVWLGATVSSVLAALGRVALAVGSAAHAAAGPLAQLRPVSAVAVTASVAGMLAVATFIVVRDFRAGTVPKE